MPSGQTVDVPHEDGRLDRQWLVFGLGNPGERYRRTRHNLGWMLLDRFERRFGLRPKAGRGEYLVSDGTDVSGRIHLIRPTTWMNLSGRAVRQYLELERPTNPALLIVVDDVNLEVGRLRMRMRGSAGGHNGLRSVQEELQTTDYQRLRLGCGPPPATMDLEKYVLAEFEDSEREEVDRMLERAADAVECWIREGPATTMSRYNSADDAKSESAED